MTQCKTAVTQLLTHWSYYSLTLSYRYGENRMIPRLTIPKTQQIVNRMRISCFALYIYHWVVDRTTADAVLFRIITSQTYTPLRMCVSHLGSNKASSHSVAQLLSTWHPSATNSQTWRIWNPTGVIIQQSLHVTPESSFWSIWEC